ncbi:hypothetical protein SteCoe_32451 [Stentor coeruleus]|uniref:Uncharacterized protein n=1 Tax=Stentor coeruleus TaxID=5963 RepID=A0A1R2AZ34_9CILI|nr:hypothetical protein SteCoe_32451 [Stentor coeruleus]
MVKCISKRANVNFSEHTYTIFDEFYSNYHIKSMISEEKYRNSLLKSLIMLMKTPPKIQIQANSQESTNKTILQSYLSLRLKSLHLRFSTRNILSKVSVLFQKSYFPLLFYLACTILFALPIDTLCRKLGFRCCTNFNHMAFCHSKWKEMELYSLTKVPEFYGVRPVTSYNLSSIANEVFNN